MRLLDGSVAPIIHIEDVIISKNIILTGVLCVPSFYFNLLSARKLTQSRNYCLIFFANSGPIDLEDNWNG